MGIPKDWVNKPTIREFEKDIASPGSHNARRIQHWLNLKNVQGSVAIKKVKGRSSVVPKLVRKQCEWQYTNLSEPFLNATNLISTSPISYEDGDRAKQAKGVLNSHWNTKVAKQALIDKMVRTSTDQGTTLFRVSWIYQDEKVVEQVPVYEYQLDFSDELKQVYEAVSMTVDTGTVAPDVLEGFNYSMNNEGLYRAVVVGYEEETVTKVIKNQPDVTIVPFTRQFIDPSCRGDLSIARFVCTTFDRTVPELKQEGVYFNLDQLEKGNHTGTVSDEVNHSIEFEQEARNPKQIHEYFGRYDVFDNGTLPLILFTWMGDVVIRAELSPYPGDWLPFELVQHMPVDGELFGEPEAALIEDNQRIQGAILRGSLDSLGRSSNGQIGINDMALDPINMERFKGGKTYTFNGNIPSDKLYHQHKFSDLSPSALELMQLQGVEAESLTGTKVFTGGIEGGALGDSVGGARLVMSASGQRKLGILRRLSEGIVGISTKFLEMSAAFMEEGEVVRITNTEFVPVRPDDLAGKHDISISISTPEQDEAKAAQMEMMVQTISPIVGTEMTLSALGEIAELRKMPDWAHKLRTFKPEPDPMQERMAEVEIIKKEAEAKTEMAKAMELQARAQLSMAKANEAMANANAAGRKADKSTLDFVEQETGTTHARHLDIIDAQAAGNIALKQVEGHNKLRNTAIAGQVKAVNDTQTQNTNKKA